MLVDSFSYAVGIYMERRKIKYGLEASKLWEAVASLISVCFTTMSMVTRVQSGRVCTEATRPN
jgi:hypothetical protein